MLLSVLLRSSIDEIIPGFPGFYYLDNRQPC